MGEDGGGGVRTRLLAAFVDNWSGLPPQVNILRFILSYRYTSSFRCGGIQFGYDYASTAALAAQQFYFHFEFEFSLGNETGFDDDIGNAIVSVR
ncbi:Hypothetical protein NTJ_12447 [Nesidiocoris tenuis]|uniref:Uncharacterized protein n=1 Tax=Nesidiocoris tenuis TaxID=355587 RepID=A0ABN7B7L8_9HEMI|nr:Hypothetical protein NTJ_12447 [Nesidiocoris tenuis]